MINYYDDIKIKNFCLSNMLKGRVKSHKVMEWFSMHIIENSRISRIHEVILQITKTDRERIEKQIKDMNNHLAEEETWMVNCIWTKAGSCHKISKNLEIWQYKRLTSIWNKGTLNPCWWEYTLVQMLRKLICII